ncbi:MAG: hypothetical protein Q9172_006675 [Xanthocarpia lactea]
MSGISTRGDEEEQALSATITGEELQAISRAHPREEMLDAPVRGDYDRVPFTETLLEKDLTDSDAPGDDESLFEVGSYSNDAHLLEHRPSALSHPRRPLTVGHQHHSTDTARMPVQPGTHRRRRSPPPPSHLPLNSPVREKSPKSNAARRDPSQPQGQRGHGPRSRYPRRQPKASPNTSLLFGQESTTQRLPKQEERQAARAKVDRLAKELHEGWHSRADKNEKKKEIQRQQEIAAGGYIDPAVEQEISKKEKRKRGGVSKMASTKPQEDEEEEDIDPQRWRRGEREETLTRMWGSASRREDEEEIDRTGNIISKKPATEPTVPPTLSGGNLEEDVGVAPQDTQNELGESEEDFSHLFEDSDDAPMPPPKKRRSTGGAWRG